MWSLAGKRVTLTLADGTGITGTARFTWAWWLLRIEEASVLEPGGERPVPGYLVVPARSIALVQVTD